MDDKNSQLLYQYGTTLSTSSLVKPQITMIRPEKSAATQQYKSSFKGHLCQKLSCHFKRKWTPMPNKHRGSHNEFPIRRFVSV